MAGKLIKNYRNLAHHDDSSIRECFEVAIVSQSPVNAWDAMTVCSTILSDLCKIQPPLPIGDTKLAEQVGIEERVIEGNRDRSFKIIARFIRTDTVSENAAALGYQEKQPVSFTRPA